MYMVYTNIIEYLKYRGLNVPKNILSKQQLYNVLDTEYVHVIFSDNIVILLTSAYNSKYSIVGADGKRKVKEILSKGKYTELIYICDINYINSKTNTSINSIERILSELKILYSNVYIQFRPYSTFEFIVPYCDAVSKHRLVTKEYVMEYLNKQQQKIGSLPKIHDYDPPIVWLGAKKGDFVEIDIPSESVGVSERIRLVI